ncbi:MAG TPA: hypothetical protein ENI57_01045 [Ignavibacteria bacterium]|nr:hypothetical protein [Ignavibacteria bacterium]
MPTKAEWRTLQTYVNDEATKLIDENAHSGYTYTNETGFSALFAGFRIYYNGSFTSLGFYAYFWSSTEGSSHYASIVTLYYNYSNVYFINYYEDFGFNVRCLKD